MSNFGMRNFKVPLNLSIRAANIYLIKAGEYYKIGCSKHPKTRIRAMQTGCPFKMDLVFSIFCDEAFVLEAALHNVYADKHSYGEWFTNINSKDCLKIVEIFNDEVVGQFSVDKYAKIARALRTKIEEMRTIERAEA